MDAFLPVIIGAFGGLIVGALVGWLLAVARHREMKLRAMDASLAVHAQLSSAQERASRIPDLESRLYALAQALNQANERKAALEADNLRLPQIEARRAETQLRLETRSAELSDLSVQAAELKKTPEAERGNAQEKIDLLINAKVALTDQFKSLANDILDEKSQRFTEQNQTNLDALLDPLKLKITEFQTKIEDNYIKDGQARSALGVELRHLKELNQQLSDDAKNLTRALRGSAKTQGTWGPHRARRSHE